MTERIDAFNQALDRALKDPDAVPDLMEVMARLDLKSAELVSVKERISAAIEGLNRAQFEDGGRTLGKGQGDPEMDDCLDLIVLTPGGAVQSAAEPGRSWIETILKISITPNRTLALLDDAAMFDAFCAVRDGRSRAIWLTRPGAEICFAATNTKAAAEGLLGRSPIVLMVKSAVPRGQRLARGADALIAFDLARIVHRIDPNHPKSPAQWLAATPPRRIVKLPDGRDLSCRIYGQPQARPVLVFSALNTSTLADPFLANAAIRFGLKLIMIERPGLGASTPEPKLDFETVARDTAFLAQALDVKEAGIYASASATSFALAAAKLMGPKITRIGLFAPRLGPPQSDKQKGWGRMMRAFAQSGWMYEQTVRLFGAMMEYRQMAANLLNFSQACPRDKQILEDMRLLDYLVMQLRDAIGHSPVNASIEMRLALSGLYEPPAGLNLPIAIWYGAENTAYAPQDLDRDFKGLANVQIRPIPGTGVQYGPEESTRMMRWLAEGGEA